MFGPRSQNGVPTPYLAAMQQTASLLAIQQTHVRLSQEMSRVPSSTQHMSSLVVTLVVTSLVLQR